MSKNLSVKYVKRAGLWCFSFGTLDKDKKQHMTIEWFDTEAEAMARLEKEKHGTI
jgi:hypothetical protein